MDNTAEHAERSLAPRVCPDQTLRSRLRCRDGRNRPNVELHQRHRVLRPHNQTSFVGNYSGWDLIAVFIR